MIASHRLRSILTVLTLALLPSRGDEPAPASSDDLEPLVSTGVQRLLEMQEGDDVAEWPYEGVYKVRGEIPIGYRVGGTAICALALIDAPGWEEDRNRREAVERATRFVLDARNHPKMQPEYPGTYDVRSWGYAYGLLYLVRLEKSGRTPAGLEGELAGTIAFFLEGIAATEIESGGWNYSLRVGRDGATPPSPFMTASMLQALFEASAAGHAVSSQRVTRGLDVLERTRTESGGYQYSGVTGTGARSKVPGSTGRMLIAEATLQLAGRGGPDRLRGAVDAFFMHWDWLEKRRRQPGTHEPPYGIAPYYFYYAHLYAAQSIELLPEQERDEYRRRFRQLLLSTRDPDGTWNDRVFERSANYGTAMALLALGMPHAAPPAPWRAGSANDKADSPER